MATVQSKGKAGPGGGVCVGGHEVISSVGRKLGVEKSEGREGGSPPPSDMGYTQVPSAKHKRELSEESGHPGRQAQFTFRLMGVLAAPTLAKRDPK